jgi:mannonate dehydratase
VRNVRGKFPEYTEVFLDEGDVDIHRVLRILHRNGYEGVILPDHAPLPECDAPWHAGMAWTLGWLAGALQSLKRESLLGTAAHAAAPAIP